MSKSLGNVDRAAEGDRHARRRRAAPVDRGHRLPQRDERLRRDPQAHGRLLPAHAQHRALPARQPARLRSGARLRCRRTSWSRSIAGRSRARASCRRRSPTAYRDYAVPPDLPEGAQLLRRRPGRLLPGRDQGPAVHDAGEESRARRSAQTAMYRIAEAMVRWLAPILSFTAEEIWRHLPGERDAVGVPQHLVRRCRDAAPDAVDWARRDRAARPTSLRELERLRDAGAIGAPLDAEVDVYCDDAQYRALAALGDELRFLLITSHARVHAAAGRGRPTRCSRVLRAKEGVVDARSAVEPAPKCVRCWHQRADVGSDRRASGALRPLRRPISTARARRGVSHERSTATPVSAAH